MKFPSDLVFFSCFLLLFEAGFVGYNRTGMSRNINFVRAKLVILVFSALIVAYGLIGGMMDKVSARDDSYGDLSVFTEVLNKIREDYVERPDMEEAMHGALLGMMEALDPYSSFVDRETYQSLEGREGATTGLVLSRRYGYIYIISVHPGSPAEDQGLRSGDLLESIDSAPTGQMSLWEAQRRLMGPAESTVKLRVIRSRRTEPAEIELARRELTSEPTTARIVEDQIGVLRIPSFREGAADEVLTKVKMLESSDIRGLLIDLRGVSKGTIEEAVQITDYFLAPGREIVALRGRDGSATRYESKTNAVISGIPIVLLIDSGTSGPAEILAAALRDHELATSVGERSNGKASIQKQFTLEDGSVLFLSTSLYYRPSGDSIQERQLRDSGIEPDLRAPGQDFISNFYFENTSEDREEALTDDFYRRLDQAINQEQLEAGLKQVRSLLLKKAA